MGKYFGTDGFRGAVAEIQRTSFKEILVFV